MILSVCLCLCFCLSLSVCLWIYLYVYMLLFFFSCWDVSNPLRHRGLQPTHQAPLFMGFRMQEYWSEMPFPLQGISPTRKPHIYMYVYIYICIYIYMYVCTCIYIYIIQEVLEEKVHLRWWDNMKNVWPCFLLFPVVLKESSSSVNSH